MNLYESKIKSLEKKNICKPILVKESKTNENKLEKNDEPFYVKEEEACKNASQQELQTIEINKDCSEKNNDSNKSEMNNNQMPIIHTSNDAQVYSYLQVEKLLNYI